MFQMHSDVTCYLLPDDAKVAQEAFLAKLRHPAETWIIAYGFTLQPMIDELVSARRAGKFGSPGSCGPGTTHNYNSSGHGDYHGWVFKYNSSLVRQAIYNSSEGYANGSSVFPGGNGIWMAGNGPVGDGGRNVYVVTGNGPQLGNWDGDQISQLNATDLSRPGYDYPSNYSWLALPDLDLGSGGALLVPYSGGNRLVSGGKDGWLFVDVAPQHFAGYASAALSSRVQRTWICDRRPWRDAWPTRGGLRRPLLQRLLPDCSRQLPAPSRWAGILALCTDGRTALRLGREGLSARVLVKRLDRNGRYGNQHQSGDRMSRCHTRLHREHDLQGRERDAGRHLVAQLEQQLCEHRYPLGERPRDGSPRRFGFRG